MTVGHLFRHSLTQPINVSHDNREISLKYDRARLDSECASGMTKSGALKRPPVTSTGWPISSGPARQLSLSPREARHGTSEGTQNFLGPLQSASSLDTQTGLNALCRLLDAGVGIK